MAWFTVTEIVPDTYRIAEPYGRFHPEWRVETVNSYVALGRTRAAVIDTGTGHEPILPVIRTVTNKPLVVLNTHERDTARPCRKPAGCNGLQPGCTPSTTGRRPPVSTTRS